MSAKRQSKELYQRAVPYELYKSLTFTTIWLEVNPRKKMLEGLCFCRAFLNFYKKIEQRIHFLPLLEQMIDSNDTVFKYNKKANIHLFTKYLKVF